MTRFHRSLRSGWTALLALCAVGCTSPRSIPREYNTPPTALGDQGLSGALDPHSRVVVVGAFGNPKAASLTWKEVGPGVSDALAKAMLNEGRFDVWTNERLAKEVRSILEGPTSERERALGRVEEKHRNVRFVVVGSVTDFQHTGELPPELRRRRLLWGTRDEAIVAVAFTMVDLRARRVLVADHVYGTAPTGNRKAADLYKGVAFGSYIFWHSPLGRATDEAIRRAMVRVNEVVPTTHEGLRVVRRTGDRKILVAGPSTAKLHPGQEFTICRYDHVQSRLMVVNDRLLDEPLRARILSVAGGAATAWLVGEPQDNIDLLRCELRWDVPRGDEPSMAKGAPVEAPARR